MYHFVRAAITATCGWMTEEWTFLTTCSSWGNGSAPFYIYIFKIKIKIKIKNLFPNF
jgi:hypothetical protein